MAWSLPDALPDRRDRRGSRRIPSGSSTVSPTGHRDESRTYDRTPWYVNRGAASSRATESRERSSSPSLKAGTDGAVVVLIDSEGDCPAELAPALLARARSARNDIRIAVILAHQEFEAWFLASASSLRGLRRLSQDIDDHPDPEGVRGCKEWLEARMLPNSKYSETADQPAFAAAFDLTLARQAPSFDKLYRET
jgi:hypothetical protein